MGGATIGALVGCRQSFARQTEDGHIAGYEILWRCRIPLVRQPLSAVAGDWLADPGTELSNVAGAGVDSVLPMLSRPKVHYLRYLPTCSWLPIHSPREGAGASKHWIRANLSFAIAALDRGGCRSRIRAHHCTWSRLLRRTCAPLPCRRRHRSKSRDTPCRLNLG